MYPRAELDTYAFGHSVGEERRRSRRSGSPEISWGDANHCLVET